HRWEVTMMSKDSKSVGSARRAGTSLSRCVRSRLMVCGAFAGAGILTLSVVAVPPDPDSARVEVRAVQLASFVLPSVSSPQGLPDAFVEKLINENAGAIAPLAAAVKRGAPDITPATTTERLTFDSAIDPTITNQTVDNAALGSALGTGGD